MHSCAAIATAPGKAGIAVIRMSGDDAIEIASKVFVPAGNKKLCDVGANVSVYGTIFSPDGEKIDSGLCTCFYAPKSFTGENTVEISCHGSVVAQSLVLEALICAGAQMAGPGEFTKRAFVNGKLSLSQAEAVGQLIDAQSKASLKLSSNNLDGRISSKIKELSDEITYLLASVYAYIDYPDEDMRDVTNAEMIDRINILKQNINELSSTYSSGVAINEGVRAAIIGKTNVGKSSLLNMLLGFDRAIVTDIAGTTRDIISEKISIGNIMLRLSDTAGIRKSDDTVEKIGIEMALNEARNGDVVFAVFDVTDKDFDSLSKILEVINIEYVKQRCIIVLNKCDVADYSVHKEYFENLGFDKIVTISAKEGKGKEQIQKCVEKIFPDSTLIDEKAIITNARQNAALKSAVQSLDFALCALNTLTPDMACLDMENALSQLLECDGRQVSEEIVNSIFSHFCVGK